MFKTNNAGLGGVGLANRPAHNNDTSKHTSNTNNYNINNNNNDNDDNTDNIDNNNMNNDSTMCIYIYI